VFFVNKEFPPISIKETIAVCYIKLPKEKIKSKTKTARQAVADKK
jgi:hypothetical protein